MSDLLRLDAVDGATPLGFLAAIGLLDVMSRHAPDAGVRLCWKYSGSWVPTLLPNLSSVDVSAMIIRDRDETLGRSVLQFRYPKKEKSGVKSVGSLTPSLAVLRGWLMGRINARDWLSLREMTGLITELATESIKDEKQFTLDELKTEGISVDLSGSVEQGCLQTAFDFTSRNAQFLDQLCHIGRSFTATDVVEQLCDRSKGVQGTRTMDWDQGSDSPGALYGKKVDRQRPVLEWLAWCGLKWLPVLGSGEHAMTTACRGRRKQGAFTWCVWDTPSSLRVAASLLARGIGRLQNSDERAAIGIQAVFECELVKAADGYGGIFSPSKVV